MPLRSVVQIEIDDSDFKRFAAAFAKYNETLKATPDAWQQAADGAAKTAEGAEATAEAVEATAAASEAVGAATAATATAFLEIGVTVKSAAAELQKVSNENAKITKTATTQESAWKSMAKSASTFSHKIMDATRSLLRWGELTGLIGGILGGGGLFGIDRLAIAAGQQRRNAMGLGTTPGEAAAFDVDYSRLLDTHAFLGGINEALHDVTKRKDLYAAGISEDAIKSNDPTQVAVQLIPYLKKLVDRTPDSMLGNIPLIKELGLSLTDIQRIRNTPAAELAGYQRQFEKDQKDLGLPSATAKAWQDLQVRFSRAGAILENTLIAGLVGLAGPIDRLSASFTKLVADLLRQGGPMTIWIDELGKGIDWLGKEIGKPEFEAGVAAFIDGVTNLVKKIPAFVETIGTFLGSLESAASTINEWFGKDTKTTSTAGNNSKTPVSDWFYKNHPEMDIRPDLSDPIPGIDKDQLTVGGRLLRDISPYMPWNWGSHSDTPTAPPPPTDVQKKVFDRLEGMQGLPPGLLNSIMQVESHGDPNATSPKGAKGYFQIMDDTARGYGYTPEDSRDFDKSSMIASRYMRDALDHYHGDLAEAIASYNWRRDALDKDIAAHGSKWLDYAPEETQKYVPKVLAGLGVRQSFDTPDLLMKFHGDLAKVAAASKVGAATVEEDVKKFGADWQAHLPIEVQNYITSVMPPQAPKKTSFIPRANGPDRVALSIHNMTGGNAYISSSQLAVG